MTAFFMDYGLFLAKTGTLVLALGVVLLMIGRARRSGQHVPERLEVVNLNDRFRSMAQTLQQATLPRQLFKKVLKKEKKALKQKNKRSASQKEDVRKRTFVIDFHGDIKATAVASLRETISAVLMEAKPADEVVLRLENAGGLVHEHGLAASQLVRIREKGIPLVVTVDKVAASGGYLMACVADRILAAPFAILGSIGVLAQMPNFHGLLSRHGIEFEKIQAGRYKRTMTLFGENTEEDRAKMQEQIDEVHGLFQRFVEDFRPQLDMEQVATGEYWYGKQALDRKLIDAMQTSDDYLMAASEDSDIYLLKYSVKKRLSERFLSSMQQTALKLFTR
jgi:serine protease SohB